MKNPERCGWLALACLMVSTAHADDANRHSAMLSLQGDENGNRQWLGKLALGFAEHAWVQGSVGTAALAASPASDVDIIGGAFGIGGRTLDAGVEFVQRASDARFQQQDWSAALTWRGAQGGLGARAFLRSATGESRTRQSGGVLDSPVTTTIRESADGQGFGLHGALNLTVQASVFAGMMRYRYDFDLESPASENSTLLSSLLGTDTALAGAWRDQAFIDRSYHVGGSYRFQSAAVTAQYACDRLANAGATIDTVQLQAEFPIATHWLVSPMVAYSSGGSLGKAVYGGLSLSFTW